MSASNKKSTFLTESSNLDEQQQQQKNEDELTKQEENSVKNDESIANDDEDEDEYLANDANEDNDEEDDDDLDEESALDAYPNPFSQQYSLFSNPNMIKEEREEDEINYDENLPPISALAPEVTHQDVAQVEVSSTPAFQCLEEVI